VNLGHHCQKQKLSDSSYLASIGKGLNKPQERVKITKILDFVNFPHEIKNNPH
jgi:hypothetical protein